MIENFNQLTPAETERLAILAEECSEVIQVIGKILRHGYESYHPRDEEKTTNRSLLESEIGHIMAILSKMVTRDIDVKKLQASSNVKLEKGKIYLHHQETE